jgi:hypothetical protein
MPRILGLHALPPERSRGFESVIRRPDRVRRTHGVEVATAARRYVFQDHAGTGLLGWFRRSLSERARRLSIRGTSGTRLMFAS